MAFGSTTVLFGAGLTDPCSSHTDVCMRTTLDLDDALVRKAKGRATDEGTTLTPSSRKRSGGT
jgi:hypothetical protein